MNSISKISPISKTIAPKLRKYTAPVCKIGTAEDVGIKLDNVIKGKESQYLQMGNLINAGTYANVYELKGWENSYVVRIVRDEETQKVPIFDAKMLKTAENNSKNVLYESPEKNLSILKRINGEPLHGKFWSLGKLPDKKVFFESLNEIINLPDEYFSKYMDDLISIRKSGYDIDYFNPNNYLLDRKNKRINIIDLSKNHSNRVSVYMKDFYPFFDAKRILTILSKTTLDERYKLADTVHNFFDRMVKIAKQKGINLEIKTNKDSILEGDFVNALYFKEPLLFRLWLN